LALKLSQDHPKREDCHQNWTNCEMNAESLGCFNVYICASFCTCCLNALPCVCLHILFVYLPSESLALSPSTLPPRQTGGDHGRPSELGHLGGQQANSDRARARPRQAAGAQRHQDGRPLQLLLNTALFSTKG